MSLTIKETETTDDGCLLTGKQTAQKIGISRSTLDRLKAAGKIPFLQFGGILRFDLAKVRAALEAYEKPVSAGLVKPEKLGVHRTGLTARDAHGRLLPRDTRKDAEQLQKGVTDELPNNA